jgi:xanthine/uracil/vitamin C permease (AzgA family)
MLENVFHLKENHTDAKTEIMAGITTFMTMAYILAVNPNILSASGMDSEAVLIATALASLLPSPGMASHASRRATACWVKAFSCARGMYGGALLPS